MDERLSAQYARAGAVAGAKCGWGVYIRVSQRDTRKDDRTYASTLHISKHRLPTTTGAETSFLNSLSLAVMHFSRSCCFRYLVDRCGRSNHMRLSDDLPHR